MKILAFTGMPFSGKSEAVKIAREKNIPVVRMGDMVWEETKKQGFDLSDENVGRIANEMRKKFGRNIWAIKTLEKIKSMKILDLLVIDGIRNKEEIDFFKSRLGHDFVVFAIVVPDGIRYERAMSRGREDDSQDLKKIKERDRREIGWGLDSVIKNADVKILNDGSFDDFRNEIRRVFDANKR